MESVSTCEQLQNAIKLLFAERWIFILAQALTITSICIFAYFHGHAQGKEEEKQNCHKRLGIIHKASCCGRSGV